MATFSDVVDAANSLSLEERETLVEILQRRIAQENRDALIRDIDEARREFQDGKGRSVSVDDLMSEVRVES